MSTLRRQLCEVLATFGAIDGTIYLLSRIIDRAGIGRVIRYRFAAQPVGTPVRHQRAGSIAVRIVEESEYDLAWFPRPTAVIADRFRQGATCLIAFHGETPIGCLWLVREQYIEDEVRCLYQLYPPDCCAWDFDVFVYPQYRLSRAFARLWEAADALLTKEGRDCTISRINAFNVASLRAHERRGAMILGDALFIAIGNLQLMLSTLPPRLHISVRSDQRPVLKIKAPATMLP